MVDEIESGGVVSNPDVAIGENVTPGTTIQSIHGFGIIQIVLTPA